MNLDNFEESKNILKKDFCTDNSKDIKEEYIIYANKNLKRPETILNIYKSILDPQLAEKIEKSIFEFSLVYVSLNNQDEKMTVPVYNDKYEDIIMNLNPDSYYKNKTLKTKLINGQIKPELIAFLSPDQIHPENYSKLLQKMETKHNTENTMATTDLYQCVKCEEWKCKVTELQMRGADEPTSKVITCLVCYNTFIE